MTSRQTPGQTPRVRTEEWVAAVSCVVSLLAAFVSFYYSRANRESADAADARSARQVILDDALQVIDYDRTNGSARQNEIALLAGDVEQLVKEYGQDRLHLSATLYRLMGQALSYSTTDLRLASWMLDRAAQASSPGSLERVQIQRVRGDIAAQRDDPRALRRAYEQARKLEGTLKGDRPSAAAYTQIYGVVDAYLGARRTRSGAVHAGFCALARAWGGDLSMIRSTAKNPLVQRQLSRIGVVDPADLAAICR